MSIAFLPDLGYIYASWFKVRKSDWALYWMLEDSSLYECRLCVLLVPKPMALAELFLSNFVLVTGLRLWFPTSLLVDGECLNPIPFFIEEDCAPLLLIGRFWFNITAF